MCLSEALIASTINDFPNINKNREADIAKADSVTISMPFQIKKYKSLLNTLSLALTITNTRKLIRIKKLPE